MFLQVGLNEENGSKFLKESLFDESLFDEKEKIDVGFNNELDNQISKKETIKHFINTKNYGNKLDRLCILEKYGSVFFNYFYEMNLPTIASSDSENIFLFPNTNEKVMETSEKRLILSSCQIVISTSLVHTLEWLLDICKMKLPQRKGRQKTQLSFNLA